MSIYDSLNPEQKKAVLSTEGPLLILAGAGSGKTRVLTHRIAYLIGEKQVAPWNIMAITFTNKAAREMRERVDALVGMGSESIWVSTFHSSCVRILRRYIDRIGYENHFTIYDADDSKAMIKGIVRRLELDPKLYKEKAILARISAAKNDMITPDQYERNAKGWEHKQIAQIYQEYQTQLKKNNALDFDDLLLKTVELFRQEPEVLDSYQERFRYIHIDEYQDTNKVQFQFVNLLARKYRNLCVVGDDDQSIYKFRGADIGNILGFEQFFPDAKVIRLEQNYRSTQSILDAANEVIRHNKGRKVKRLWTENEKGDLLRFRQFANAYEEAEYVAGDIKARVRKGEGNYSDFAILYRTNAQSRLFEEKFMMANLPYKLVGGVNFYARKEIKDMLAYLKTVDNGQDDLAALRIINVPRRGIGAATINRVAEHAAASDISFYDALLEADQVPGLGRALNKIKGFTTFIQTLRSQEEYLGVEKLLEKIMEESGYAEELRAENTDEAKARLENLDELLSKAAGYEASAGTPSLNGFLQEVALVADIDNLEENGEYVLMMTLHSAKGLEFDHVYMVGMEDGTFPGAMSIHADSPSEMEEERRLCYVGITRARKSLTMTAAQARMLRGEYQYFKTSRFVREIPRELVDLGRDRKPSKQDAPSSHLFPGCGSQGKIHPFPVGRYKQREITVQKANTLDYGPGDRVSHARFGLGTVTDIVDGGKDYEVTVEFDKAGRKKMFASFAKLEKQP